MSLPAHDPDRARSHHGRLDLRARSSSVHGVRVDFLDAGPSATNATNGPVEEEVHLLLLPTGRVFGTADGLRFDLGPNAVAVFEVTTGASVIASHDSEAFRIRVRRRLVPWAHDPVRQPLLVLAGTPMVQAAVGFAHRLIRAGLQTDALDERLILEQAVVDLQRTLLAEVHRQRTTAARGTLGSSRRQSIEHYIDAHLGDAGLGPRTIAVDFGLSLRSVHNAFADSGDSVASIICARRIAAVQQILVHEGDRPNTGALARRLGFSGRDQLARSFRRVTGQSLDAWRASNAPA